MSLILPHIDRISRYALGVMPEDPVNALKLNQNESPYPPSPQVHEALLGFGSEELRCYPDGASRMLREALADRYGVEPEQTFCGNGSSEIISLIMKVFIGSGRTVALPDPTFELYHSAAYGYQAGIRRVPLNREFEVDADGLLKSAADAMVLVNPNAPTGRLLPGEEVRRLVSGFDGLVVVDEAYMEFAEPDASAVPLIREFPNLIVLRTFSKAYGLCGARVGCCFADKRLIGALEKGKDIYNVNAVSGKLALAALRDRSYTDKTVALVKRTRDKFSERLQKLGFLVIPSSANFLLCTPPAERKGEMDAGTLYGKLLERGIYVRYFGQHPRLCDKLRISVGTEADMERLSAVLQELTTE
jgi:histidinol-phosphate aminotransferase